MVIYPALHHYLRLLGMDETRPKQRHVKGRSAGHHNQETHTLPTPCRDAFPWSTELAGYDQLAASSFASSSQHGKLHLHARAGRASTRPTTS